MRYYIALQLQLNDEAFSVYPDTEPAAEVIGVLRPALSVYP